MYSVLHVEVISPISKLNRLSSSLHLFGHVPFKRDQLRLENEVERHSKCNSL